jgi:hypothetical protein
MPDVATTGIGISVVIGIGRIKIGRIVAIPVVWVVDIRCAADPRVIGIIGIKGPGVAIRKGERG